MASQVSTSAFQALTAMVASAKCRDALLSLGVLGVVGNIITGAKENVKVLSLISVGLPFFLDECAAGGGSYIQPAPPNRRRLL